MRQGIQIVAPSERDVETLGPPVCKVCLEPINGGPVALCASCHTPHHGECWEYVGGCSIYGCGCKERAPMLGSRS